MIQENPLIALTFVAYIAAMIGIGIYAWRRTHNLSDYILGGRRLNAWVTALSAGASDMSGWLLLGLPGAAYIAGYEAAWIALGLWLGTYLNWRVVARGLRRATLEAGDALTLPDYFARRFGDDKHVLRVICAVFILMFFMFYTSSGLVAGGKLFNAVFDLPYGAAVVTGTALIVVYTFLGGFLAVSWTDLVQGILMMLALVIVPLMALVHVGGWGETSAAIHAANPALLDMFSDKTGEALSFIAIASLLGWGLGYFGQPHILARFMAIHDENALPRARRIAMSWVSLSMGGALIAGFIGIAALPVPLGDDDSEKVFIELVGLLLHPLVAGVCLAAILAAIMSTADSQLLVSASALSEDFYKALFRPDAGAKELVWVGRGAVIVIAIIACVLALEPDNKVLDLVAYAWAGFGASFGPAVILSLYWKPMNRYGALAGILTGGITVIVWKQLTGGWFDLYELVPGFVLSALAIIIVSKVVRPHRA